MKKIPDGVVGSFASNRNLRYDPGHKIDGEVVRPPNHEGERVETGPDYPKDYKPQAPDNKEKK